MAELIEAAYAEKLIAWPTPQDYNEAVQTPSLCFADLELKSGVADVNEFGLPRPISGGFASVYRLRGDRRDLAVRCFLNRISNRAERYESILKCLQDIAPSWAVPCEFLSNGMQIGGLWYPIVKMQWVQGQSLSAWIEAHLAEPQRLRDMAVKLRMLVSHLQDLSIAHGDLQPANIIVMDNDSLKLVDYDGMFVPSLSGTESNELGHKNFQHPSRQASDFNHRLDNFSICLLTSSMEILACDASLWHQLSCADEALLFRQPDLIDPDHSYAFSILENHSDPSIVNKARILRTVCHGAIDAIGSPLDVLEADSALPEVVYTPPETPVLPSPEQLKEKHHRRPNVNHNIKSRIANTSTRGSAFAASLARDLQSRDKLFTCLVPATIFVFVCLTLGTQFGLFVPLMGDWFTQSGVSLFDAAHDDMDQNRSTEAEAKFDQVIARFHEPNFGLQPVDLVEAMTHKAELARAKGRPDEASRVLVMAEKLAKELPPDQDDGHSSYEPNYFLYGKLMCRAKLGELEPAADGLISLYGQEPAYAAWDQADVSQLIADLSSTNLSLSMDLWKVRYRAELEVDPENRTILSNMENDLFRLASQYVAKGTPKDFERAEAIYLTLKMFYSRKPNQTASEHAANLLDVLNGLYMCDLKLGLKNDAANFRKRMKELNPKLQDVDFVTMSVKVPTRPASIYPKSGYKD